MSIDYCFLRRSSDEKTVPVLVAMVRKLGLVFAHVVPFKGGSHKEVVAHVVRDLARCGFNGKVVEVVSSVETGREVRWEITDCAGTLSVTVQLSCCVTLLLHSFFHFLPIW